jgi:2-dehydro-3-deoxy-D-gluconate 5-dehydrogenase
MNLFDLKGKVAIVTGGSSGLGKDIAKGLASAGADIAIVSNEFNESVVKEIEDMGVKCVSYKVDLREFDKYDNLIDDIVKEFGTIDILINNAGVQKRHASVEFPKNDWDFVMDVNCNAVFFMCQKVGKVLIEKGYGKIVNMASLLSFQGGLTVPAYAASKSAVMGFTKSLSNEWASLGVNVNCIAPGYMDTEMNVNIKQDEVRNKQILDRIPAGRWGKPQDLVGTAIFLSSSASDYVSGFTIAVDGGWLGR